MKDKIISLFNDLKKRFLIFVYELAEFFDKSPEFKDNEEVEDYVSRVDKKYALRYLNTRLSIMTEYNPVAINEQLEIEKDGFKKEILQTLRRVTLYRFKLELLQKKILKTINKEEKKALNILLKKGIK
jgi:hypothetical protein